jgi:adenosylcobinamide amidohydrolase
MPDVQLTIGQYVDDGRTLPALVWTCSSPVLVASSAPLGGGIGVRRWVVNAQVPRSYTRVDIEAQLQAIAAANGCHDSQGVGMLTAAAVEQFTDACDGGVRVWATVGVTLPTWAAAPAGLADATEAVRPGTINIVATLPVRLSEAALVNAVMTVTEAKTQALFDCGIDGTGTATDAVCIACPLDGPSEPFGGPRSPVGSALARAVYDAVHAGAVRS